MKKLADKLRSGSFWIAAAGAVTLLITRFLGIAESAEIIADTVGAVLLLFGIVIPPATGERTDAAEDSTDECGSEKDDRNTDDGDSPDGEDE